MATAPTALLGRDVQAEVRITSTSVSRRHALLEFDDGQWVINDLDSTNGVFVNGDRVQSKELANGDLIGLGALELTFHATQVAGTWVQDQAFAITGASIAVDMRTLYAASPDQLQQTMLGVDIESKQRAWMIGMIARTNQALMEQLPLRATLRRLLDVVLEFVPAEESTVCMPDGNDEMVPIASAKRDSNEAGELPMSRSVVQHAMAQRQAVLVDDVWTDPLMEKAESRMALRHGAVLCAPLCWEDRNQGFIYLASSAPRSPFEEDHLVAMTMVALMLAAHLEQDRLLDSLERERKMRERLSRYHSAAVVEEILNVSGSQSMVIRVDEREVTVLFCDMCGFTSLSENLSPVAVAHLLNMVFDELTSAVFAGDGMVDKFMGDGIMVVFGAPMDRPDHAPSAIDVALKMVDSIQRLNAEADLDPPLAIRISINSGIVVAGDIGSMHRKDFTVIGDAVNVASRLESQVAQPGQIVIGPRTRELAGDGFVYEALPDAAVKGRTGRLSPSRVVGRPPSSGES